MLDYCVYLFYRAGVGLFQLFPLSALFGLGQLGGTLVWLLSPKYRRLALHNVHIAFREEISPAAARRLVRQHFQHLGANVACSVKFARMPMEKILQCVEVENVEYIENCLRRNQPLVLLLSHLSCWELCAQLLPRFLPGRRKSTVYQRVPNKRIDAHIRAARARFGIEVFDRREGFAQAIALLRGGGAIGILSDQHAGDHGVWTPFFGRLASSTPLPALLAKRTGAELLPVAIVTQGFARWRAVVDPPLEKAGAGVEALTARGNAAIERQVRRAPADWFWVHNRWKTPKPNFLLARYKRGVYVPPGTALKPFRILLRSSNWLGDAVMSVPAVRAIKAGRLDARVIVAAPEKLVAFWREVAEVDEVVALAGNSVWGSAQAIKKHGRFDVAVLFPNSLRSALEVWLARVPRRAGFAGHWRRYLLHQHPRDKPASGIIHQSTRFLQLAATLGAETKAALTPTPLHLANKNKRLRCALCPGAEYGPAKRWLPERFAEVARALSDEAGAHWVLLGTAADTPVGATIAAALGQERCENLIAETTVSELISQLRQCDLLLTNDTGTMHLAAFLGLPTIAIFGSTEPRLSAPVGVARHLIRHHVECSPCFLRECPLDFRCMHEVSAAEVLAALRHTVRLLRRATFAG